MIERRYKLSLPFASDSFDCLVSDRFAFSNYHHLDPYELDKSNLGSAALLMEAARIIKPGGIFILAGVHGSKEDWKRIGKLHFTNVEHFEYTPQGVSHHLQGVVLQGPKKNILILRE
jgi:SAM-dependent methyltransferase